MNPPGVLEFFRSQDARLRQVPDEQLAQFIGQNYPDFEQDAGFSAYLKDVRRNQTATATTPAPQLTPDNTKPTIADTTAGGPPVQPGNLATTTGDVLKQGWQDLNTPLTELFPKMSRATVEKLAAFAPSLAQDYLEMQPDDAQPHPVAEKLMQALPTDKQVAIATGTQNALADLGNYFTSPLGIGTLGMGSLPSGVARTISAAFALQMASQTPQLARELGTELGKPEADRDYQKIAGLVTSAAADIGFATAAGKHAATPGRINAINTIARTLRTAELPADTLPTADPIARTISPSTQPATEMPAMAGGTPTAAATAPESAGAATATPPVGSISARPEPVPVPEPAATLQAQFAATLDPATPKAATLVTPGAEAGAVPDGLQPVETEAGTFWFNPEKTSTEAVQAAAEAGNYGPLLGLSTETKPAGDAVLQTKTPEGVPVQEEVVTPQTLPAAAEAGQAVAPQGTQELKPAEQVIAERSSLPVVVTANKINDRIVMQFDAKGRIPTPEELEHQFRELGFNSHFQKTESPVAKGNGMVRFWGEFTDLQGRSSSKFAEAAYQKAFGSSEPIWKSKPIVVDKGPQELKPAEQVIAERAGTVEPQRSGETSPTQNPILPRHFKEARQILDAERPPDVLDEISDHFRGVKIPATPDFDWVRERIKALRQSKTAGLSRAQIKTLFDGTEPADVVMTALNGQRPRFQNLDEFLGAMLNAAETRVGAKDSNRPEVRQLAEQIAKAEAEPPAPAKAEPITDWDAAVAAVRADLGAMSGTSLNASKGRLAADWTPLAATLNDVRPMETPEILRLTRDAFGSQVAIKKLRAGLRGFAKANHITLRDELFSDPQAVAMVLAHEIGHVNDFMPEGTLARGNLLGRLLGSTKKFMQNQVGWMNNKAIRDELVQLSAYWRPWDRDKASKSFIKYRDSAKELYADALSVLLNSPGLLQQRAPKFFKAFFNQLDAKPQFKQEFFALQDLLNRGPEAVLQARSEQSLDAYRRGEDILHEKIAFRQATREGFKNFLAKINTQSLDIADYARRKLRTNDPAHPSKFDLRYEEWRFDDNRNAADLAKIYNDMVKPVLGTGLDEHTLGLVLELQRVRGNVDAYRDLQSLRKALGPEKLAIVQAAEAKLTELERKGLATDEATGRLADSVEAAGIPFELIDRYRELKTNQGSRAELANAQGRSPVLADAELNALLNRVTPEQRAALLDAADKFRALVFERAKEARDIGIINATTFEHTIVPNQSWYAAFRPLDKIEEFVAPTVRRGKGTLNDLENPFITTLLKLQSLNRLIDRQKTAIQLRDDIQAKFGEEAFKRADQRWTGRSWQAVPAKAGEGRVIMMENGRKVEYNTDPYIAKVFDQLKPAEHWAFQAVHKVFAKTIYPFIIKYNPGFLGWSNPRRDLARTIRNLYAVEGVTRRELLPNYADPEVLRAVRDYLEGRPNPLAEEMIRNRAITPSWEGFSRSEGGDVMTDLLRKYKLAAAPPKSELQRRLFWLPQRINEAGAFLEALPKFASYKTLKLRGLDPERNAYLVRNYAGTPNFKVKGELGSVQNAVLPFTNIFLQGLRADLRVAFNPRTAAGWWTQWFLQHGWQAILVGLASAGVFGKDWKRRLGAISEYDKSNYSVYWLGQQMTGEYASQGGKAVVLRVPRDETSRLMSAITYKITRAVADKAMNNQDHPNSLPTEVFAFGAGTLPSPSPILDLMTGWGQYLAGRNPYDPFHGRPVISDRAFNAGGTASAEEMFRWTLNQSGAANFFSYDPRANTTTELVVGALPIVNRAIKITDAGRREEQLNSERIDQQARDQVRVHYNEDVKSLLAQHSYLQRLGRDKRTPEQENLYTELHAWKVNSFDRDDADAWDQNNDKAEQKRIIDFINRAGTALQKQLKASAATAYGAPPTVRRTISAF